MRFTPIDYVIVYLVMSTTRRGFHYANRAPKYGIGAAIVTYYIFCNALPAICGYHALLVNKIIYGCSINSIPGKRGLKSQNVIKVICICTI